MGEVEFSRKWNIEKSKCKRWHYEFYRYKKHWNRKTLRRLTKEDAQEAYNNWCSKDVVAKYVIWEKHKSVEVTKELFEMWEKEYEKNDTFRWIVEIKETNELIGTIDVVNKKFINFGIFEIGYCYGNAFWNKGYGSEALRRVINFYLKKLVLL